MKQGADDSGHEELAHAQIQDMHGIQLHHLDREAHHGEQRADRIEAPVGPGIEEGHRDRDF